ncbi:MAG: VWA domain-containing protein [Capsulimonadaceae bacterium]|nr:VWA domain-containing protein [Capsulimonadaceae bacterium]
MLNFEDNSDVRRLPIFLLLDTSGSMTGAPIQAVNEGLRTLQRALQEDPHALETAHISIITFGGHVEQVCSMVPADTFEPRELVASGTTPMGEALLKLNMCLDTEVRLRSTDQAKADWKPLVFLFSDGEPTDGQNWREGISALKNRADRKMSNFIAIGAGPSANLAMLKELGGVTLSMSELTPQSIADLFSWISQSAQVASRSASRSSAEEADADLPELPRSISIKL